MQFNNDGGSWSSPESYAATKAWTLQALDGLRTVNLRFSDAAGNTSSTISTTITLDRVAPSPGTIAITGAPNTSNDAVALTLNATGASMMQFSNNNVAWSPLVSYGTSQTWSVTDTTYGGLESDGVKTVYARYQDSAGNLSSTVTGTIRYDSTPPTGTITFHNLTTFATVTNVQIDLACSDTGSGCSQMQFSNDGTNWLPASPAAWSATYPWTLPNGDGTKTVYARYKDAAGNWSNTVISSSVILDTTLPAGSIAINNLATYATSTAVTLTLSCTDADGCSQMQFNNEGAGWSPLEPYATTRPWNLLPADGLRTVNVRYKDAAGNTSGSYTAAITLDRAAPVPGTVSIAGASTNSATVTLTMNATGASTMQFSNDGSELVAVGCVRDYACLESYGPDLWRHAGERDQDRVRPVPGCRGEHFGHGDGNDLLRHHAADWFAYVPQSDHLRNGHRCAARSRLLRRLRQRLLDHAVQQRWGDMDAGDSRSLEPDLCLDPDNGRREQDRVRAVQGQCGHLVEHGDQQFGHPGCDSTDGDDHDQRPGHLRHEHGVTLALTCSDANGCSQMQFKNDSGSWSMPAPFAAAKAVIFSRWTASGP